MRARRPYRPTLPAPRDTVTLAKAEDACTFEVNLDTRVELDGPRVKETVVRITRGTFGVDAEIVKRLASLMRQP